MKRYRHKETFVRATRVDKPTTVRVNGGKVQLNAGDWIVIGVDGEKYPMTDDAFRNAYVCVEEDMWRHVANVTEAKRVKNLNEDIHAAQMICVNGGWPLRVYPGEWIVTGIDGKKYPCSHETFLNCYEEVDD